MKRSKINKFIIEAEVLLAAGVFPLPPWAAWTPEEWKNRKDDCEAIFESRLGWDLTDFGSGDYLRRGLLLITIRNGNKRTDIKPYAEKIMIIKEKQETPFHFHWHKTEDIINRGGGNLVIQLYNSDENEDFADSPVDFLTDGIRRRVNAGERVILTPGESITLQTGVYHRFYAEEGKGTVIAGEVSMTNDDFADNRFFENCGRFPDIEEDEKIYRALIGDYEKITSGGLS
ncbi:MAG: D-lyxose/D-mannose family sugar isomerase [Spirochaetales bacterium]|nr:D-lyxose/D-mannose family sugar isomerase [Spirochaetales bacterium]